MVAVHPYKGGHNAVCDMEVLIPFSQIKYLTQNFFSISCTAAYCIFPEIFEVFSFSQGETSKKFSFGLSFWLMVRVMKEDFFLSTSPKNKNIEIVEGFFLRSVPHLLSFRFFSAVFLAKRGQNFSGWFNSIFRKKS